MTKVLCCMQGLNMKEVFEKRHQLGIKCMMVSGGKIYNEDFPDGIWMNRDANHLAMWLSYYNQYNVDYILMDAALDVLRLCYDIFRHNVYMIYPSVNRYEEIISLFLDGDENVDKGLLSREEARDNLWSKDQWNETIKMIESTTIVPLVKLQRNEFVLDLIHKDMSQYDDFSVDWGSKNLDVNKMKHLPGNDGSYTCEICKEPISSCTNHIVGGQTRICLNCARKISNAYITNFNSVSTEDQIEVGRGEV